MVLQILNLDDETSSLKVVDDVREKFWPKRLSDHLYSGSRGQGGHGVPLKMLKSPFGLLHYD